MSQQQLYRKSGCSLKLPVDSAIVIEAGDMCFLNTNDVRPATSFTYVTGNLDGTQANFAAKFVGVAKTGSISGATADITITKRGVFEFDCASSTFEFGDLVGPDDNTGGTVLEDQKVIGIGENGVGAIGRVFKRYGAATVKVLVELFEPHFGAPIFIPLASGLITSAVDMLTDWPVPFPLKAIRMHSVVTVAVTGACDMALHNGANALDDVLTIATGAAVGEVDLATFIDANEYDIFIVGDTMSLACDGVPTTGEADFKVEVRPFNMQVA
jgi:hypothetical protein